MTLKELSQLYYLNREIERDREKLETLRRKISSAKCAGYSAARGNFSGENGMENYIAEIVELEKIVNAKKERCLSERVRLERYISEIPDSLTRQIFALRFINGLNWTQIAFSVGGGNTEASVKMRCYRYLKENKR